MRKSIFKSTIILFISGFLLHYAYDISNNNFLVGLFSPINESVFEHLKLSFYPTLIWWLIFYIFNQDRYNINKDRWFTGCLVSIITSILTILAIYYIAKCGLGINSLILDISSLYIGLFAGQYLGYHIYNYYLKSKYILSIAMIFIFFVSFIVLTILPQSAPIFID
ncbi:MAG: DUF6512 family protein [Bacilli bacterium]|nr:DUF6512 family protein [Bacilli bacterium]